MTHIVNVVESVNGNTFMGIDTCTIPKLKGGQSNPQQGRITKVMKGASVMVFQNLSVSGYEAMIRRRLTSEGKDPSSFKLGKRAWGTRMKGLPIVEHNGSLYLEVIFLKAGEVHYELDGSRINETDVIGLPDASNGAQGGLENKVVIRTFKVSSLTAVRINNTEYTNIEE